MEDFLLLLELDARAEAAPVGLAGRRAVVARALAGGAARARVTRLRRARRAGWAKCHGAAADHRHGGDHGGPLAAVLPAVERHRQAAHPALDGLRAGRLPGTVAADPRCPVGDGRR